MNKTPDGPYRVIGENYQKWRVDPRVGLLTEESSKSMMIDLTNAWFELERKSDIHITLKLGDTRVVPFKINHPDLENAKYQVFVGAPAGTITIMLDHALFPQITGDYEIDNQLLFMWM